MKYYFAPMEGLTDMVYRRAHAKYYPGIDRYYTPFVSPNQNHSFAPRELRELSPENNAGIPLVPQLIGKNAEDFLWAAGELEQMGYKEVNLNLGCPSGTVTAKGKGAGFLAYPDRLDSFLETIFSSCPIAISIKTRLGIEQPEEFGPILEIYNRYPVRELIIHPRTKREMYIGNVHLDSFRKALENTALPLCYNGNLFSITDIDNFSQQFPTVLAVMLGRGLVADPGLIARTKGYTAGMNTLHQFHRELCKGYTSVFGSEASALPRMKAIWSCILPSFHDGEQFRKQLIKAKRWRDFIAVTEQIFQSASLLSETQKQ